MHVSWIRKISLFLLVMTGLYWALVAGPLFAQSADLTSYQAAEQLLSEKSYQLALDKYKEFAAQSGLTAEQKREAAFRIADCSWRSGNNALFEGAAQSLKEQVISTDHDRWWAEANFSLAEYLLQTVQWGFPEEIKGLLISARDFWAGFSDTKVARPKFIAASFVLADHITRNWGWYFETPNWGQAPQVQDKSIPAPSFAGPVGIKSLMEDMPDSI